MGTRAPDLACDVLIAGGGPAGNAAAITLRRHGAGVIAVDPGRMPRWKPGESLAPEARPLLARLGVLDRITTGPHTPCFGNQSAWGNDTLTETDFLFSPYGAGWHLDRVLFDHTLTEAARRAGTHGLTGRVRSARRVGGQWQLVVDATTIHARYLLDATGAAARLARHTRAAVTRTDHLVAVAALLPSGASRREVPRTSLVESAALGWWYTAPLAAGACVVMAMTDADLVGQRALHTPERWWKQLMTTTHVRRRVRHAVPLQGRLRVVRAATSCTHPAAGPGWAAVGDAATASDPIAARGILTALATGISAADAVNADAAGSSGALDAYAERIASSHEEYLHARRICYGSEKRWDTPFWARRRREMGPLVTDPSRVPDSESHGLARVHVVRR
ncbi:NAD(P)/FAD-dependent oxidoreductase [Streptomyces abikoensis]|uniref:NAD(P)/FAD-dependent oxidoreductase n=1 Tax=Streptomyces abikoensis TaxID=97398 RepID=UPI0033E3D00A